MVLLCLFIMPSLIVNIVSTLLSRRRPSLSFAVIQSLISISACLVACVLYLIPADKMNLYSFEGMFQLSIGKTTVLTTFLVSLLCGLLFGAFSKEDTLPLQKKKEYLPLRTTALAIVFLLLILTQGYFWGSILYSSITLDEILFHLNMPLEGTAAGFIKSVLHSVFFPAALAFLPIAALSLFPAHISNRIVFLNRFFFPFFPLRIPLKILYPGLLVWLVLLFFAGDAMLGIRSYISGYMTASTFIEENYVSPNDVAITFPREKRNLITIYLESFETTNQDTENGGALNVNLIPEMTQIAKEHISFSRNEQLTGAAVAPHGSWTMSGLIAQTAALPLMHIYNQANTSSALLPGAITLGDLLREQGYRLMFMAGSDFVFGGRQTYFSGHGGYSTWDLLSAKEEGRLPNDYYENWGFEDAKLFEYAKEMLLEISQDNQPFHFAMLTADTHAPGYRCSRCPTDYQNKGADALNYADTLRCTSIQCAEFLSWCQQQPFYENTTIVITGDHLSMQEFFYRNMLGDQKAAENIERYTYNAFINAAATPVKEKNRLFTTLDIFPTTLASLGVSIDGNRLGLGTNLFSEQETLSEQYGEDHLFAELEKRSVFYDETLFYQ